MNQVVVNELSKSQSVEIWLVTRRMIWTEADCVATLKPLLLPRECDVCLRTKLAEHEY